MTPPTDGSASGDELRGSTPMQTARDVLLEVRADVRAMSRQVDILASQNLDARLEKVERWSERVDGRMSLMQLGIIALSGLMVIVGTVLAVVDRGLHP